MLLGLATPATILLAQGGVPEWLTDTWHVLLVIIGFSVVIFFHELGHFVAAKWAGVRVERFAIGFGRELLGFTWGDTRYSFNVLPLGGYVKMLGQEDFAVDKSGELKVRDDPSSFTSKPVGPRMVIVCAGVVMNLIFAAVVFAAVMMMGRMVYPPIVGYVDPTSVAARAGLRPGDQVVAVNDEPVNDFSDLMTAVVLSDPAEELELTVLRDGNVLEPKPRVLPEYKPEVKLRQIGLGNAVNRRVLVTASQLLGDTSPDALKPNDLIVGVRIDGQTRDVAHIGDVSQALIDARGLPIELIVERPTQRVPLEDLSKADVAVPSQRVTARVAATWRLLPVEDSNIGTCSLLGMVPRLLVADVDPRGAGALGGLRRGDVIVRVGAIDHPTFADLQREIERHPDRDLRLLVRRDGNGNGPYSAAAVAFLVEHRERLLNAAITDVAAARELAKELVTQSTLAPADQQEVLATVGMMPSAEAWLRWLEAIDLHELVVRPATRFRFFRPRTKPALGITPIPAEDDHIVLGDVLDSVNGRASPARAAGLTRGAAVMAVDGKPMTRWTELTEALRLAAGRGVVLTVREGLRRSERTVVVPDSISTAINLPTDARIVEIAGATAAKIESAPGRSRTGSLPDWQVVEAILKKHIGETVTVKYLCRDGRTVEAQMKVTEANTDPWLLRVSYAASFMCYPLAEFHRETNPVKAMLLGFKRAYHETIRTYLSIKHIVFTREVGVENVRGPVGIMRQGSQIAEGGFGSLLWFLGLISANLAVINFLPLPIVDGGLFIFLLLEKIRGEPVSIKTQVVTQLIGIALIVTLFLFVTFQDIVNW